jgi:hypothetical protein
VADVPVIKPFSRRGAPFVRVARLVISRLIELLGLSMCVAPEYRVPLQRDIDLLPRGFARIISVVIMVT